MIKQHNILIFKTNIQHQADVDKIADILLHDAIISWNVDTADVDCVLRVVTTEHTENDIIDMITAHGYFCEELI